MLLNFVQLFIYLKVYYGMCYDEQGTAQGAAMNIKI